MRINTINPTNFEAKIRITAANNKHPYLYNIVSGIVKDYHLPATYKTDYIELPRFNATILELLNKMKIIYEKID